MIFILIIFIVIIFIFSMKWLLDSRTHTRVIYETYNNRINPKKKYIYQGY